MKIIEYHCKIMKTIKITKLLAIIMKIMKILEFHLRITKIMKIQKNKFDNNVNHENLIIPMRES